MTPFDSLKCKHPTYHCFNRKSLTPKTVIAVQGKPEQRSPPWHEFKNFHTFLNYHDSNNTTNKKLHKLSH